MNIQDQGASDQDTAREETDSPRSNEQRDGTQAREYIENREYDTFIDGDAQIRTSKGTKQL